MSMVEIEDLKEIIGNITDITIITVPGSKAKPMIFLNDSVRAMTRNKEWWHPYKEWFVDGCVVHVTVDDPKMHALNITGNYMFRFDPLENTWTLVSPIPLHLIYTRHMKCLIGLMTNVFDIDIGEV